MANPFKVLGGLKSTLTCTLRQFSQINPAEVNLPLLESVIEEVESLHQKISNRVELLAPEIEDEKEAEKFVSDSVEYRMNVKKEIASLKLRRQNFMVKEVVVEEASTPTVPSVKLPLPPILLDPFENNVENPFSFFHSGIPLKM